VLWFAERPSPTRDLARPVSALRIQTGKDQLGAGFSLPQIAKRRAPVGSDVSASQAVENCVVGLQVVSGAHAVCHTGSNATDERDNDTRGKRVSVKFMQQGQQLIRTL
jgi:hypothetical protein